MSEKRDMIPENIEAEGKDLSEGPEPKGDGVPPKGEKQPIKYAHPPGQPLKTRAGDKH